MAKSLFLAYMHSLKYNVRKQNVTRKTGVNLRAKKGKKNEVMLMHHLNPNQMKSI